MPIILPAVTLDATGAVEGLFFGMGRDKMGWFARGQASSEGRGMVGATREREEEKKRKKAGKLRYCLVGCPQECSRSI